MYITNLNHLLDEKGAIGIKKGAGFLMADFQTKMVTYATHINKTSLTPPNCFKCKNTNLEALINDDGFIYWRCYECKVHGQISNWRGSLWDMSKSDTHSAQN